MTLTTADETKIQRMFDVGITNIKELNAEIIRGVHESLVRIETQTIKTNGRVSALEQEATEKRGADKWKKRFETIFIVFLSCVGTLVTVFTFLKNYNP